MEKQHEITTSKDELISLIINKLLSLENFLEKDVCEKQLNPIHQYKLATAITLKERIIFVLPAFPAKSGNRNKTLSHVPDLGEVEALRGLNKIAAEISMHYGPGVEIIICSDGRVFSDLVGVTEEEVSAYKKEIEDLVSSFNLSHISLFSLEDVYSSKLTFEQMRYSLERDYSNDISKIKDSVRLKESSLNMFNGIHRFIKEDYLFLNNELTKNQINKLSKEVAYKVIQRSNAWSSLVESRFPSAFRLSIHPQDKLSEKFPVKLIPSDESWGTPWHRVPVLKNGNLILMKAEEVKKMGGELKKYMGKYNYFELGVHV